MIACLAPARCGWPTLPSSSSAVTWCSAAMAGGSRSRPPGPRPANRSRCPSPRTWSRHLQSYLATWRPRLARAEYLTGNPALWPTQRGTTISDGHALQHHHRSYPGGLRPGRSTHICFAMPPPPPSPSTAPNRCGWPPACSVTAASRPPSATTTSPGPPRLHAPGRRSSTGYAARADRLPLHKPAGGLGGRSGPCPRRHARVTTAPEIPR